MLYGISEPEVPTVTVDEVFQAIQDSGEIMTIDVRTLEEYDKAHIQKSINIPVEKIDKRIASVIPDKTQKIYMYCLSGARSTVAVDRMIKLGYTNVFSMKSGLLAWRVKRFPLESQSGDR